MSFGRKQSEALLDRGQADLVAETADGVVELVIVADAPCTGSDGQWSSLQDKVQTCVSFAVDGQVGRSIPEAVGVTGQTKFVSHIVRVRATTEALGNDAVTAAHAAQLADRVFVDVVRSAQRRFCSPQCQSRVKASAHRARKEAS
jgi:CGNR zinc finger